VIRWCIDHVNTAERSSARERQTRMGWGKQTIFKQNASLSQK